MVAAALAVAAEAWLRSDRPIPRLEQAGSVSGDHPLPMALAAARLALPIAGSLVAIPLLASRLAYKLYATEHLAEAHNVLNRLAFGRLGRRPLVIVKRGEVTSGRDSFAERTGGPATFVIYNDTAVMTEQHGKLGRILGAGIQDAEPFEKVWEAIDLRPQRWIYEVFALTKEGIPVSCKVDLSFQIDDQPREPWAQACTDGPYPYAEDAVFRAATSKWIREPEREDDCVTWAGRLVIGSAEGALRNILAEYRLDWLIAPPQPGQPHPRDEIRQRLREELEASAISLGAKLLDVEIGTIEVKARDEEAAKQLSHAVSKQWIEAWHADWQARTLVSRAEGEAELLRMDSARIQAQAEMVVALTETLQSTIASQGTIEPYILALRFVEALRWMSYHPLNREFMPPEAMRTLKHLQETLEDEGGTLGATKRSQSMEGT